MTPTRDKGVWLHSGCLWCVVVSCRQSAGRNWNSAQDYLGFSKTRVSISEGMKRINRCHPLLCQLAKSDCFQISGGDCMYVCVLALRGLQGVRVTTVGAAAGCMTSSRSPASLVVTGDCTKQEFGRVKSNMQTRQKVVLRHCYLRKRRRILRI